MINPDRLQNPKQPKQNIVRLYQWNWFDGSEGGPVREFELTKTDRIDLSLLKRAWLGGGSKWDKVGTPERSILCLELQSAIRPNSTEMYYRFFEEYKPSLALAPGATVIELSGFDRAMWRVEAPCREMDDYGIRAAIEAVMVAHTDEIKRIRKAASSKQQ